MMGSVALVALGILVGVLAGASQGNTQPLPQNPPTTQEDCGCGVPSSPRGPR